jgi:hypothetical protein
MAPAVPFLTGRRGPTDQGNMNDIEVIAGIGAIGTLGYMLYHWAHLRVGPPLAIKRRRIVALELDAVREKATKRHGWDEGRAKVLESEYRDFLILLAENDGKTISPWSDDLDLFWHEHILDTRKYAQDCKCIFGHFIQHDPHIHKRPYHHEETRRATIALREAQLAQREERRKAASTSRPGAARPIRDPQLTEAHTATRAGRTVDTAAVTRAAVTRAEATAAVATDVAPDAVAGTEGRGSSAGARKGQRCAAPGGWRPPR